MLTAYIVAACYLDSRDTRKSLENEAPTGFLSEFGFGHLESRGHLRPVAEHVVRKLSYKVSAYREHSAV